MAALWPTPTSTDSKASGAQEYGTESGRHSGTTLTDAAVRQPMWATPQAHDAQGGKTPEQVAAMRARGHGVSNLNEQAPMWSTPRATDGSKGGPNQRGSSGDLMLPSMAAQRNTPSANDWKGSSQPGQRRGQLSEQAECSRPAPETPTHGEPSSTSTRTSRPRLNPAFAAWLMGWPDWWTHPESINCAASAMVSYRSRLRSLLDGYCGGSQADKPRHRFNSGQISATEAGK